MAKQGCKAEKDEGREEGSKMAILIHGKKGMWPISDFGNVDLHVKMSLFLGKVCSSTK